MSAQVIPFETFRFTASVVLFAALVLGGCSSGATGNDAPAAKATEPPAAKVPVLVLTEADAGTTRVAEAGDGIEVRLTEERSPKDRWVLRSAAGPATLRSDSVDGDSHVFRFATAGAGRSELSFARGARSVSFVVETR